MGPLLFQSDSHSLELIGIRLRFAKTFRDITLIILLSFLLHGFFDYVLVLFIVVDVLEQRVSLT